MRRDSADSWENPRLDGLGPATVSVGRVRTAWLSREPAVLILLVLLVLVWLSSPGPDEDTARMRFVPGGLNTQAVALAFSPDGNTIATTYSDGHVALRDRATGWDTPRFLRDRSHDGAVTFSPDGRSLAVGGNQPDIVVCDRNPEGAERRLGMRIAETMALAFSPDSKTLAATGLLRNEIVLWDLVSGRERTTLQGHSAGAISIAFSPDGRSLASGGHSDAAILVWDLPTGRPRLRLDVPAARSTSSPTHRTVPGSLRSASSSPAYGSGT